MKKVRTFYLFTIALWVAYFIWEIVVRYWAANQPNPVLRFDLMAIVPVLGFMTLYCIVRYWQDRSWYKTPYPNQK